MIMPALIFICSIIFGCKGGQLIIEADRKDSLLRTSLCRELVDRVLSSGQALKLPPDTMVTCSNGHRYKHIDFQIVTQHIQTTYEQHHGSSTYIGGSAGRQGYTGGIGVGNHTYQSPNVHTATFSTAGCPLCKSSIFTFDNAQLNNYQQCPRCRFLILKSITTCPICKANDLYELFPNEIQQLLQ